MATVKLQPLASHAPLCFEAKPGDRSRGAERYVATRLLYVSDSRLRLEGGRLEPRLRQLLGHISIHEGASTWIEQDRQTSDLMPLSRAAKPDRSRCDGANELPLYLQQVPTFQSFQAAIKVELVTMAQVMATAAQLRVETHECDSEDEESDVEDVGEDGYDDSDDSDNSDNSDTDSDTDTDGDNDSHDHDHNHNDTNVKSCQSLTDVETLEVNHPSECTSPADEHRLSVTDDDDLWAVRPLTTS